MIPQLIILKAAEDRHVLLSLSFTQGYIDAIVVENSKHLFRNAEWRSDGLEGRPENYVFRRVSSRSTIPKKYNSTLCKTSRYIIVSWHEPIHIYTMTYSGVILPSAYFKVYKGDDIRERWHFRNTYIPHHIESLPSNDTYIPPHIIRSFVESAIQKKDICPITLEALVMGNVAMTSCGHLFDKEAIRNMMNSNTSCPTCRSSIKDLVIL